jgi:hypothetical protein
MAQTSGGGGGSVRPHLISILLRVARQTRAAVAGPLEMAWRRLQMVRSSGATRLALQADYTAWRGDGVAAAKLWRELERQQPDCALWPVKIAQVAKERGDLETAERVLLAARERGLDDEKIELDLLRCARLSRRSNTAVADAEAIVEDAAASATKIYYAAFHLLTQNRLAAARSGFLRVLEDRRHGALARGQLAAIDLVAARQAQSRFDVPGRVSPVQNSVVVREPSSDTLVVGFTLPEGTLGLPLNAALAMLSSTAVNALYLYDSQQVFHLAGTDRFGPGYQAMIDGVRALADDMGTRRLITVGGSGTGYTAIRAGIDLKADGALVFSPGTLMDPRSNPAVARNAQTLHRLRERALPMMTTLRPLVKDRTSCPQIEIFYGGANLRDISHAGHLAGLPGVSLHAVPGFSRHDCLTEMARRGYRDLLKLFPASR